MSMVFTKLLLEKALAIRPYNCEAVSEPLLPTVAHCIPVHTEIQTLKYAFLAAQDKKMLDLLQVPIEETQDK